METIKIIIELIIIISFIGFGIILLKTIKEINDFKKIINNAYSIDNAKYLDSKKQRDFIIKKLDYLIHKR